MKDIELDEGWGLMFHNSKADKNPKAPKWKGEIMIEGQRYNIAEWEGIGTNSGKPYRRVKVERGR